MLSEHVREIFVHLIDRYVRFVALRYRLLIMFSTVCVLNPSFAPLVSLITHLSSKTAAHLEALFSQNPHEHRDCFVVVVAVVVVVVVER